MTVAASTGSARAVTLTFAASGAIAGAGFSRVPALRDSVGATPAQLSLALVCVGIGSVAVMPLTGRFTERLSSAWVVRAFAVACLGGWALAAFAPSVPVLAVTLLLMGAGAGVWDVAMNVQGHVVEERRRRDLMPGWHATWSYSAVGGAAVGAAFARLGVSVEVQYPLTCALALLVVWWSTASFVDDRHDGVTGDLSGDAAPARGITRREIVIGLIVLCAALGEGAANDWLALTLVDTRGLPEAFGALALAGFNLTMGTGRLVAGRLIARWGRVPVLQMGGLTAALGVVLLCLVDSPVTAALGAALWGLGLSAGFPSGMSAAGEVPGRGPRAISVVSTIGYGGFLLGAPLIGQLTRLGRLDRSLLVVAGVAVLLAVAAPAARERRGSAAGRAPAEQG